MNDEHEDNGGRHAPASQEDLITGLADALPDPSDDSSVDAEADEDEVASTNIPPAITGHVNEEQSTPDGVVPSVERTDHSYPQALDLESAGLLNRVIEPSARSSAPVSSLRGALKSKGLKRISDSAGPIYAGINASKRVQRRMVSRRVNVFDIIASPPSAANQPRVEKAPSVDPESMSWQTRDTAHRLIPKKRKLGNGTSARPGLNTKAPASIRERVDEVDDSLIAAIADGPDSRNLNKTEPSMRDPTTTTVPSKSSNESLPNIYDIVSPHPNAGPENLVLDSRESEPSLFVSPMRAVEHSPHGEASDDPTRGVREAQLNRTADGEGNDLLLDGTAASQTNGVADSSIQQADPAEGDGDDNAPSEASDSDGQENMRSSHSGADLDLVNAFKTIKEIGIKRVGGHIIRCGMPAVKSRAAKGTLQACIRVIDRISETQDEGEDEHTDTSAHLMQAVSELSAEAQTLLRDGVWSERTVLAVHLHVLPKLTILLRDLLKHFGWTTLVRLSYPQLDIANTVMRAIIALGLKAGKTDKAVKTDFPVKNRIKTVVRHMSNAADAFRKRMSTIKAALEADERRKEREERLRAQQQEDERAERRDRLSKAWRQQWDLLHSERIAAELNGCVFVPRPKLQHLKLIPLGRFSSSTFELDGNGEPIERMQLFSRRRSQPPGQTFSVETPVWDLDQAHALIQGLREFAGPRVYVTIIRRCCLKGGLLRDYNVTEIVDQAMWWKRTLIQQAQEQAERPEDWIIQIWDPRVPPRVDAA